MLLLEEIKKQSSKSNPFVIYTERVPGVEPKLIEGKKISYFVRVFIEKNINFNGFDQLTLDEIALVKYQLHSSYKEPVRVSENRSKNFEINIWTIGYFPILATIYPKIGDLKIIEGYLKFTVTPEEKAKFATK